MSSGLAMPRAARRPALAAALVALPLLAGCGSQPDGYPAGMVYPARADLLVDKTPATDPPTADLPGRLDDHFARLAEAGGKTLDPNTLTAEDRQKLDEELARYFGTPAEPRIDVPKDYVKQDDDEDTARDKREKLPKLRLDAATLAEGSKLYRRHCLHCHGLPGDGRGPTGVWVNPHPRDFRQGTFKFVSTDPSVSGRKPRREDLLRTLRLGVEGTSMPSFGLLDGQELEQLASYVVHLSLRGEVEFDTLKTLLSKEDLEGGTVPAHVQDRVSLFLQRWADSNDKPMEPPPYATKDGEREASVLRGYELFKGQAGCLSCHQDFGRQVNYKYDLWGTLVRPADLTAGVYRGGRRPLDLYYRVRGGIPPSAMPENQALQPDQYWDLVNFVQALPYPEMLPGKIRGTIYPAGKSGGEGRHASR